jgi:macrolide-specific efflux system membrane fusion protein
MRAWYEPMNDSGHRSTTASARPRLRLALAVLAAIAIAAAAWYFLGHHRPARGDAAGARTVTVELGTIENTVTAVGALQPKEYVDVGTQVSGQLQKVHVQIGDRVKKGDLIAEIDPTRYESTVRNDRATLENLHAQLNQLFAERELAAQQLKRNQNLGRERAVTQEQVDESVSADKVAQAKVAATQAQLKAAQATLEGNLANLGYTKIYAPMDGTVIAQTTLEGQTVNASQQAPVIVRVANLDVMTVWAKVAEADVTRIKPDMPAYFSTLGMPDRQWHGKVRQVQPTPESQNDVVLFNVLIDVDNTEQLLLPSMTVQTFFVLGEAKDVPVVPINALTPTGKARGSKAYTARVQTAEGVEERQVRIGVSSRTTAQVVSGLAVGDRVLLPDTSAPRKAPPARMPGGMGPAL